LAQASVGKFEPLQVSLTISRQIQCKDFALPCAIPDNSKADFSYSCGMRNNILSLTGELTLAAAAFATPVYAADTVETRWIDLCKTAGNHALSLTTQNGGTLEGTCISIDVNGVQIRNEHKVVTIARSELTRVRLYRAPHGRNLAALGKMVGGSVKEFGPQLLSPMAPFALTAIPTTVAYAAVAAPFCAIGDIVARLKGKREVKVI
jgi:hypothetical protein